MEGVLQLLRLAVFGAVLVVSGGALAVMAVQRRMLNPFGAPARTIRGLTDPLLRPIERRLLRSGGNPQSAPWWLLGIGIVGGILVLTLTQWLIVQAYTLLIAASRGGRSLLAVLVDLGFGLLMIALVIRVVGSWFGVGPYARWMRPWHTLTEWFLRPLRRVLPPFGMLDLSPLVAWFGLLLLRGIVLGALLG